MPDYTKRVPTGETDRDGNPTYISVPSHYKKRRARRPKKARKATRSGHAASNNYPKSSSSTFFSALAIPRK